MVHGVIVSSSVEIVPSVSLNFGDCLRQVKGVLSFFEAVLLVCFIVLFAEFHKLVEVTKIKVLWLK